MRKNLVAAMSALATLAMGARTLTPEQAIARMIEHTPAPAKAAAKAHASLELVQVAEMPKLHTPGTYLFANTDGAFVLLSADDVAAPVLGYADSGVSVTADTVIPEQLSWLMGEYAAEIQSAVMKGAPAYRAETYATEAYAPIAPLVKVTWNQDAPYNDLCPKVGGKPTMTGCAATAMAQVMKYFEYPQKCQYNFDYTTTAGTNYKWAMNTTFDWANMLPSYGSGNYTSAQATAVATLMKACGYSLEMNYGNDASGALSMSYPNAFVKIFGYDSNIALLSRIDYPLATWQQMVYNNLANVGPVIMSGSSNTGGGHAFVCDGYSSAGYFHFNWGWEGAYNGYYLLTALNPDGQGIGGFAGGYNIGTDAVFNIQRPGGTTYPLSKLLTCYQTPYGSVSGTTLTINGAWYNLSGFPIKNVDLGAKFVNVATSSTSYVTISTISATSPLDVSYGYQSLNVGIPQSLANGSYRVSVVYRPTGGAWEECAHSINVPDYVVLTKSGLSYSVEDQELMTLEAISAQLLTPLYKGKGAKISYKLTNLNSSEVQEAVAPCLLTDDYKIVAVGDCEVVDLLPGETYSNTTVVEFAVTSSFATDTPYTLGLYDPEEGVLLATMGSVTVAPTPTTKVQGTTFTLQGGTSGVVDVSDMKFNATVKCTQGYFTGAPEVYLGEDNGSGSVTVLGTYNSPDYMFLNSGESASTVVPVNFANAEPNQQYYAFLFAGNDQLEYLSFTTGQTLGLTDVSTVADRFVVMADRAAAKVYVSAPAEIASVVVTSVAGVNVATGTMVDGVCAAVDLSSATTGIYIVTVTTTAGETFTAKTVR